MIRKVKRISKERIIELVQSASFNNNQATFTQISKRHCGGHDGGALNDVRPSLNYWTECGILECERISKQSLIWKITKYANDDLEIVLLKVQEVNKIRLDNSIDNISGKKIINKSKPPTISVKYESDYWKMNFAFERVSEFYVKLLLHRENENNYDKKEFLNKAIHNTMATIKKSRKKLIQDRPIHEIEYLEKTLEHMAIFDTKFP